MGPRRRPERNGPAAPSPGTVGPMITPSPLAGRCPRPGPLAAEPGTGVPRTRTPVRSFGGRWARGSRPRRVPLDAAWAGACTRAGRRRAAPQTGGAGSRGTSHRPARRGSGSSRCRRPTGRGRPASARSNPAAGRGPGWTGPRQWSAVRGPPGHAAPRSVSIRWLPEPLMARNSARGGNGRAIWSRS